MKCREIGKSAGNPLNLLPPVDRKAFRDAIITISIASASDQKISHAVAAIHDHFTSPLHRHARHYVTWLVLQGCDFFESATRVQVYYNFLGRRFPVTLLTLGYDAYDSLHPICHNRCAC